MKKESKTIQQVKDYIKEHLNEAIKLDEIAKTVGYSKFHLNRMFKEETETTIHQYILKLRIEQSAQLLLNTNQTVLEIALSSGYTTQQSYTVAFRQIYEMTPQGYRIQHSHKPSSTVNNEIKSERQRENNIVHIESKFEQMKVRMAA
ncbi:MAG: AraC family transcriptional regulator [Clostridiales bacterium]|nr:AraC family transcriptional regulator [Clostridiales bacterium]